MLQKCKYGWLDLNIHVFLPKTSNKLSVFLRNMGEISHFYITIKCKAGVDFYVPRDRGEHQNPFSSCSLLLRPFKEQNGSIDIPCTSIMIMNHLCNVIL